MENNSSSSLFAKVTEATKLIHTCSCNALLQVLNIGKIIIILYK
ncbi:hypothetical protein AB162_309 [Candidatus Palibaumannia cicadellinicola]|uniref:Uncharacterized protein n=1 Tax=Candidatus Palibaumannia cicadellinicola TaxID=186490 RepID=A0A0K2BLG4_9GAMM|nr:hypothetical protein AB162_309 [Candidatus Baumannia cicadellinicola]